VALQNNLSGFRKLILVMVFLIKGCESRCPRRSTSHRFFLHRLFTHTQMKEKICSQSLSPRFCLSYDGCRWVRVCISLMSCCCVGRLPCCSDAHVYPCECFVKPVLLHGCISFRKASQDRGSSMEESHLEMFLWPHFCHQVTAHSHNIQIHCMLLHERFGCRVAVMWTSCNRRQRYIGQKRNRAKVGTS
jgi:hypothetical protein